MPGFSYPTPFEFEESNSAAPPASSSSRGIREHRNGRSSSSGPSPSPGRSRSGSADMDPINENSSSKFQQSGRHRPGMMDGLTISSSQAVPARRLGPKTKSGRCLPKPVVPSRPLGAAADISKRGRSPPKKRGVGQSRSANLESMRTTNNARSSSLPKRAERSSSPADDEDTSVSPQARRPSSLKNFLLSPLSRNSPGRSKSGNLEELRRSLQKNSIVVPYDSRDADYSKNNSNGKSNSNSNKRRPSTGSVDGRNSNPAVQSINNHNGDVSPEQRRPSSLKNFLISPLRLVTPTRTKSGDLNAMATTAAIGPLDLDDEDDDDESSNSQEEDFEDERRNTSRTSKASSRQARSRRRRDRDSHRHSVDSMDSPPQGGGDGGGLRDKPKTFKQLLGSRSSNSSNGAPDNSNNRRASQSSSRGSRNSFEGPSNVPSTTSRQAPRERSLSPPGKERTSGGRSMITSFLDTLYDSYIDPKAGEDAEEQDDDNLHNSVSRFDMSISNFLT